MKNPGGYAVIVTPTPDLVRLDRLRQEEIPEGTYEADTFTCFHCNRVVHTRPRMDPADLGGLCKTCMRLICPHCLDKGCEPFEKQLEQWEAKREARRSYGF